MSELPVALSAVSLRLAGEVGQTALDRVAAAGAAARADLDQHIAAVRANLAVCQQPLLTGAQLAGLAAGRSSKSDREDAATGAGPISVASCPDVPFVASAVRTEEIVPLRLLLHYTCGFLEAAVSGDWWPEGSGNDSVDWESMRLAAICELISQAEAAAALHPDLRAFARGSRPAR